MAKAQKKEEDVSMDNTKLFTEEYGVWKKSMIEKYGLVIVPTLQYEENGIMPKLSIAKVQINNEETK